MGKEDCAFCSFCSFGAWLRQEVWFYRFGRARGHFYRYVERQWFQGGASLGSERETSLFKLSGHVRLTNKIGKESDYWAECIGLSDSKTGSDIRCVWRSLDGDEIYLVMKGTRMEKGSSITGTIIGGTIKAQGIISTLRFTWSMIFKQENNETGIRGISKGVSGTYKLP